MEKVVAYFDGACEPVNPGGNMGIGAIVLNEDETRAMFKHSKYVKASPGNSNNVAEYMAFIAVLDWLVENNYHAFTDKQVQIIVNGDSNLVVQQMNGRWRIKQGAYVKYAKEAKEKLKLFKNITLNWIPRDLNSMADELSKRPMKDNNCEFRIQKDA